MSEISELNHAEFDDDGWSRKRANIAMSFICNKSEILNLGCGYGFDSDEFTKNGHIVTGVDFSEKYLRRAKKYQKHSVLSDITEINLNKKFGSVAILQKSAQ